MNRNCDRDGSPRPTGRRGFLARTGTAVLATGALAGCVGNRPSGTADGETTDGGQPGDDGASAGDETLAAHPAARDLDGQPMKGPRPGSATGTILAFEDPSCPRCKAFEEETVPKIESNLVESGDVSFVFRGYPIVYEWGDPATKALEAVYDRDAGAFWALLDHYFADQSAFDADTVLGRTREFLAGETDLDAEAVVADVEAGAFDDAVQTDLAAGEDAGASATPTVFLFRDGTYRTKAQGSVSYEVLASALGL